MKKIIFVRRKFLFRFSTDNKSIFHAAIVRPFVCSFFFMLNIFVDDAFVR